MTNKFTPNETVYFNLLQARDIVATRWKQCGFGVDGGPRCAVGAIREVTGVTQDIAFGNNIPPIYIQTRAALAEVCPYNSIVGLNDFHYTNEPILKAFDKAIANVKKACDTESWLEIKSK